MKKVAVIGTGYVGLVAGACFADSGHRVICVDRDQSKIDRLLKGEIPIYEPGLEDLVERSVKEGLLEFTVDLKDAVSKSEIIFFAVGTPSKENGEADLQYLKGAAIEVGEAMDGYRILVNKSTVPVGTHAVVAGWVKEVCKHDFDVVSNPEFLKEGSAVDDFLKPDRVVIGTDKDSVFEAMSDLYAPFVRQGNPILRMDPVSAETAKYACNAFLATRISFMNEMANLCERVGGDIENIRKVMASDPRIGSKFLYSGVGYGGSCFPKDVKSILFTGKQKDSPLGIIEAAEDANEEQKHVLADKIDRYFRDLGGLKGKVIGVLGLAFKPNTDDLREAPSLVIIPKLLEAGAKVRVHDPVAMPGAKEILGDRVSYHDSIDGVLDGADAMALVTEWNLFRNPDWQSIKSKMRHHVVFDGRNVYTPEKIRAEGFEYFGIGRK